MWTFENLRPHFGKTFDFQSTDVEKSVLQIIGV